MRLASLEITGFKSFARHVSLKFQSGNTAIVGPNGSGKSNIADAIRWVLGEQSMKTLRGKKLEDVIYAGGTTRGRLGMAEVSLTLENDENGAGVLDSPEVVITRRLYRSGESAYLVNNRPVRLLDVGEILAKAGFAQKTYTVIGQGMADSFVNATPVERRAMFEDATGVTSLLIKKEQTERKLEQAKENMTRAKDHLSELEPRLRSLKRQAVRARQREEVETELRAKEEKWFSYNWLNYKSIIDESDSKLAALLKVIQECNEKISKLQPKNVGEDLGQRLPELRSGLEKLRQEEQEISIMLAKAGNGSVNDINRRIEEKNTKESERQRLITTLEEVKNELENQEGILQKVRENLRVAQENLLGMQGGHVDIRMADVQKRVKDALELQESLIKRLSRIDDLSDLIILREDAGKISVVLRQLIGILENGEQQNVPSVGDLQKKLSEISGNKETLEGKITNEKIKQAKLEMQLKSVEEYLAEMSRHEFSGNRKVEEVSLNKQLDEIRAQKVGFVREIEALEKSLFSAYSEQQKINKELDDARQKMHTAEQEKYSEEVRVAGTTARKEDMEREIAERVGQEFMSRLQNGEITSPQDFSSGEIDQEIRQLRKKIELIGGIDPNVIQEEADVEKRVNELTEQLDDLEKTGIDMRAALKDLDKHIHQQFSEGMKKINETFNVYFRQVFGGGKAGLSVIKPQSVVHEAQVEGEVTEDEQNPESVSEEHVHELPSGVEIKANPPGKKLGSISQLSGGEKALTSVALLFAIISQRSSPFIVLDEVDAALDEANSHRFSRMLKELSQKTQFLVITHNRATMESANALYGVTMQEEGVSQLLSVKLSDVPEEFVGAKE